MQLLNLVKRICVNPEKFPVLTFAQSLLISKQGNSTPHPGFCIQVRPFRCFCPKGPSVDENTCQSPNSTSLLLNEKVEEAQTLNLVSIIVGSVTGGVLLLLVGNHCIVQVVINFLFLISDFLDLLVLLQKESKRPK